MGARRGDFRLPFSVLAVHRWRALLNIYAGGWTGRNNGVRPDGCFLKKRDTPRKYSRTFGGYLFALCDTFEINRGKMYTLFRDRFLKSQRKISIKNRNNL